MSIPITPFLWMITILPILILLILMVRFQWGAIEAAPAALAVTALNGVVFYRADLELIAVESAKGIWSALTILVIVWTAVLLYQVGNEANAFSVIRDGMKRYLPNELLLVLSLGWVFTSFLQGITGFGVPVAVGAPLLIGIGVNPLWAVVIPLLGQSWGNTYGTLGAAWDALAMSAGMEAGSPEYFRTALYAALFLWVWNLVLGLVICWFYGRARAVCKGLPAVLVLSVVQGGGELFMSQINTTTACFLPACISLIAVLLLGRLPLYREDWRMEDSPVMSGQRPRQEDAVKSGMSFVQAILPYVLLTAITLVVLMVGPVKQLLGSFSIGFAFPETATGYGFVNPAVDSFSPISPFTHASMFLLLSALAGLFYYKKHGWITPGGEKRALARSVSMTIPSGIAVIGLVAMSRVMSGTGQTAVLANGIAQVMGKSYVFLSPFVGMFGSFMTGSNMSSNILFGEFQQMTSQVLGVNTACVLGAQTAGGSIGSAISPSNIVLGTTTANILGREGEVLRKTSCIVIPIALAMGVLVYLFV